MQKQGRPPWYARTLFSNDSLLPAGNALSSSFRRSLEAEGSDRFEIFTEFLDAERFPGPAHEGRMAASLRDRYASIPIDLTIALGPQALGFLSELWGSLFPGTPSIWPGRGSSTPPEST